MREVSEFSYDSVIGFQNSLPMKRHTKVICASYSGKSKKNYSLRLSDLYNTHVMRA